MIRTLEFVCSECGEHFVPGEKLDVYKRQMYMLSYFFKFWVILAISSSSETSSSTAG